MIRLGLAMVALPAIGKLDEYPVGLVVQQQMADLVEKAEPKKTLFSLVANTFQGT